MKKIKIKRLPKAKRGMSVKNQVPYIDNTASPNLGMGNMGTNPSIQVNSTLKSVPRNQANLEAEKGETAVTDLNSDGLPEFYKIGGQKHSKGGTPLNLPDNSFIYSNDKSLRIKDPEILKQFGKGGTKKRKGYTPAELSKTYDINKFRKVLADPNSDKISVETAELMIKNYMDKLGALALVQESMKGFENGIPAIATPYLQKVGISSEDILPPPPEMMQQQAMQQQPMQQQPMPQQGMQGMQQPPQMNYGGPIKRKVRINNMPVFDNGGESNKPTKKQNIPENANVIDADNSDFDPSKLKEGDYVKRGGKYYKIGKRKSIAYDGPEIETLDPKLKGEYGDLREAYGRLVKKFNTDKDVRNTFIKNFDKEVNNLKADGKSNFSAADIQKLKNLSEQEKIDYFLNGNKHHMMIAAQMGDVKNIENVGRWDKGKKDASGIPLNYKSAIGQVGLNPMSVDQTLGFQAGFIALQKMQDNPDMRKKLKNFKLPKTGVEDEGAAGYKNISKADGWEGNTTAGEMFLWAPDNNSFEEEEVPFEDVKEEAEEEVKGIKDPKPQRKTPYWTQDARNVAGSLYDLATAKKYSPWQATPQMNLATPNFADFRGAAGRLQSMAQSGAQQLGAFGSPQGFSAGFANMQRNLAKNISQLQDQEYKTNIGTANQFELANTDIKNKFGVLRANMATDLFNKETMANQSMDNTKRALRRNVIDTLNTADTNRGQTQTINESQDNFYTDPRTGFTYYEDDGRETEATNATTNTSEQVYNKAKQYKDDNPDMGWAEAYKFASAGIPTNKKTPNVATDSYGVPVGSMYPGNNTNNRRRRRVSTMLHGGQVMRKCRIKRLPNK